ncbi:restriction endonuclease subunit S [Vibrio cholerae]
MNAKIVQPIIRFKPYEDAWQESRLAQLCSNFKSGSTITSEYINQVSGFPVYGGNGLRGYTDSYTHEGHFVLIGRQGALCGNINEINGKSFVSEHAIVVGENTQSNISWLKQKLTQMNLNRYSESSAQPGLSVSRLKRIKIFHPKVEEQQKIADFLTAVDTKINQLTEKHRLLKEYKKGVMQQLFSQKIRFKDEGHKAFPDWTQERLDYFIERISDPVSVDSQTEYREIGIRSHGKGIFHKESTTGDDIGNKRVFWVKPNALVLNIVFAWERAVAVTSNDENGFIASHRFPMYIPKANRADVNYLLYFFLSPKGEALLNLASPGGAGRNKTLGQSEFMKLKVRLPSQQEQQKIAQFLQALDSKITAVSEQIEQTKQFKKGLLQQMFV